MALFFIAALTLLAFGCTSTGKSIPAKPESRSPAKIPEAYSADLKSRLDHILDNHLRPKDAIKALDQFEIDSYNITR